MTRTVAQIYASRVSKAANGLVQYSRANPVDDVWDVYQPATGLTYRCWAGGVRVISRGDEGLAMHQLAAAAKVLKKIKLID